MRRLLVLLLLAVAVPAHAASSPSPSPLEPGRGVSVLPVASSPHRSSSGSFLELGTVRIGSPVRDAVRVLSNFDAPTEVLLYGADAQPAIGGGFGFSGRTDKPRQVGAWLRLAQSRVTVPAGGAVEVPLALVVPRATPGGEYVGAVVAEAAQGPTGGGLQTRTRFAMAVYLKVPGGAAGSTPGRGSPTGTLQVLDVKPRFQGGRACPVVHYRNDSQDIVDPRVSVRTEGLLGSGSRYGSRRTGAVLPGTETTVALPCLRRPLGPGKLVVTLRSPHGGGTQTVHAAWLPLSLIFALLLLLLLVGALLVAFGRGRRGARARGASPGAVT